MGTVYIVVDYFYAEVFAVCTSYEIAAKAREAAVEQFAGRTDPNAWLIQKMELDSWPKI